MSVSNESKSNGEAIQDAAHQYSLENEEERLGCILSCIKGVGGCELLLSLQNESSSESEEQRLSFSVLTSTEEKSLKYPDYKGAVVVIEGYENAHVRFDVLSAVMSYTGLSVDKITICPLAD